MTKEIEAPPPVASGEDTDEELFRWLGRRDAFSLMAGRCSAAHAECIKRIRESKRYLKHAKDWEDFCEKVLHMSKSKANHLLRLLDEFGHAYFYIAEVTGISVKDYRACIAPAVSDRGLVCNGETIGIAPENNDKIAQAVALLRATAAPAEAETPRPMADQVLAHVRVVRGALDELRHLRYRHGRPDASLSREVESLLQEVGTLLVDVR